MAPGEALPRGEVLRGSVLVEPSLEYYAFLPAVPRSPERLLVLVHGISELPRQHVERFAQHAEERGVALIAPHFARPVYGDYQRLGRAGLGARADEALLRMLDEFERRACISTGRIGLFGYSGGGQFAHRFLMAHPLRVAAAVVASAGWYTFPDPERRYPHGIRATRRLADLRFDADAFLRVPILVTVGESDLERNEALRITPRLDREQGRSRLERAERWVEAMARAAARRELPPAVSLQRLDGVGHSFVANIERGGLAELAIEFLAGRAGGKE